MTKSRTPMPSIEEAVGKLSITWASVELALTMIVGELMETDPGTALTMSAAVDYRHKRDLINSLAAIKLKDTKSLKDITWFMGQVKGMNKERNDTIHALWHNNPDTGALTRLTMRNQGTYKMEFKRVSPRHLQTIQRKMAGLSHVGAHLVPQLRQDVCTWRETHPPLDWPRLEIEEHPTGATPHKL